jgi:hypothetical protein
MVGAGLEVGALVVLPEVLLQVTRKLIPAGLALRK